MQTSRSARPELLVSELLLLLLALWKASASLNHPLLTQLDLEDTGDGTSLFALFDSHSGKEVAIFAAQHLPALLVQVT